MSATSIANSSRNGATRADDNPTVANKVDHEVHYNVAMPDRIARIMRSPAARFSMGSSSNGPVEVYKRAEIHCIDPIAPLPEDQYLCACGRLTTDAAPPGS